MSETFQYIPQLFPREFAPLVDQPRDLHYTSTRYYDRRSGSLMWPVFHRECAEVAFFMTKDPRLVTNIRSFMVFDREGKHPPPNTEMICGSCHERILKTDLLAEPPPRKKIISIPMVAPKEN
jgi:hypothetical protein